MFFYIPLELFIYCVRKVSNMADDSTPGANGDNKQTIAKPLSLESVSEDDRNKAEQLKEKANEYFKSNLRVYCF